MKKIKVSIIVPVYNVEKYIDKCLDSLVNQTLKEIEIIVVNDGSPDNSQSIIDKYAKKYPKIVKSFITKNGGQGSARNFGLTKAHGEYIGYVDSDDYIDLHMYEDMYNKAKSSKLDLLISGTKNVYENSNYIEENYPQYKEKDPKINAFFNNIGVWNKIYKKSLVEGIDFKSKVWYEDLAFTCKIIMKAKKIDYIDECYYYYVNRNNSTMNNNNIKRNLEILDAFDDILMYLKDNKLIDKYYQEIEYIAIFNLLIASTVRLLKIKNNKEKINVIRIIRNYFEKNFPTYKNNKYLNHLDRNKKIIYTLLKYKLYFLVSLIFKVKDKL